MIKESNFAYQKLNISVGRWVIKKYKIIFSLS